MVQRNVNLARGKVKSMLHKAVALTALVAIACNVQAQKVAIPLNSQPVKFVNPKICIDSVADGRDYIEAIGIVKKGGKVQAVVDLKNGVANAVKMHCQTILPCTSSSIPFILKINALSFKHSYQKPYDHIATFLSVSFYVRNNLNELTEVYRTTSSREESSIKPLESIEKLIRFNIEECLEQLNAKDAEKLVLSAKAIKSSNQTQRYTSISDSISLENVLNIGKNGSPNTAPQKTKTSPKSAYPYPPKAPLALEVGFQELSTIAALVGKNANGWSATYYFGNLLGKSPILLPLSVGVEYMDNLKGSRANSYQTSNVYYSKIGVEGFYPINKYIWFSAGVQLPLGNETLADNFGNSSETVLIGISSSQALRFIANDDMGFSAGVGVFQQLSTSRVQPFNWGIKVELGIVF